MGGATRDEERRIEHVGSIDIDLVVDPDTVDAERYATTVDTLVGRGWQPITDSRFQFARGLSPPREQASPTPSGSIS